ncbi:uncharacterized protein GGS22DRAFT_168386 [Annulohypoxylon maeteangense]|uniref:uncharacterized protein n=1 Tax=Annulohypoxylon maeteangense TaxID=1927788 RepID=UPI002008D471|nr:uncharacterized protein GGS22DRAFT_168386 [Annulohypoxylon maeteangense]KAI0883303.1 hypothetical protein GGS22DRAFT_168386 [Annulohypoxylon maeteangense]
MSGQPNSSYTPPMPRCPKCRATFLDGEFLRSHQHQAGHLMCGSCEASFHTIDALFTHRKNDHKAAQDLTCPGCTKKFTNTSRWIYHIESGQCCSIFPSDISQGIATVMEAITKNLIKNQLQGEGNVDFSGPSHITDAWGDGWTNAQNLDAQKHPKDFPKVGKEDFYQEGSKNIDLAASAGANNLEQKTGNVWAQKKNLFPEKKMGSIATPTPQSSSFENPEEPALLGQPTGKHIIDPTHEYFNVAVFWNPILETYICPHRNCNSKFDNSNKLVRHLKSSTHSGVRFNCPGCRAMYTSASSWVQHVETVSLSKCRIRESREIYGYALKEITHGALDVDTIVELPNATAKVKVVEDWAKAKKPVKNDFVPGTNEYANAKQAEALKRRA